MESIFATLCLLLIFGISGAIGVEWPPHGHHSQFVPQDSYPSGPRLRREYPGGRYQYQPSDYTAPILPRVSASARTLAAYLASDGDDYVYCPPNNPTRNKRLGLKIFQEVLGDKITTNIDKYFLPNYIQHNPSIADGVDAFKEALSPGGILFGPRVLIDFRHVGADGDYLWLHARRVSTTGAVSAHLDLFRFECGKIAEHWDVIQSTDVSNPANDHPFF